ncbi:DUF1080 domain-containing protein [candidate division KSB1 bacterium]|nr:DUF1080 domain-containing protein [candidate division KSB1 bacterium]
MKLLVKKSVQSAIFIFSLMFLFALTSCRSGSPKEEWISLFNGKDLSGWKIKISGHEVGDNYKNTFRVEDGKLVVSYDEYEKFDNEFGHIFYEKPFSNYVVRLEYRFIGDQVPGGPGWAFRNNGIMFHSQSPESMRLDQDFPVSIEAQLLGGNGTDERSTGNVCTPGTNIVMDDELITQHCTNSISETYHGDQWVTVEVIVHGSGDVYHVVNGDTVLVYEQSQYDENDADAQKLIPASGDLLLSEGYIALQAESHPTEFRKIEVKILEE